MNSNTLQITCPHCEATNRVPQNKLELHPKCGKCHQVLFTGLPLELSNQNFTNVIHKTDVPVVIDFWAPWCGPCKMMALIFQQASTVIEPHARLAKLNTEISNDIAAHYGIRSIPTLIIFKKGKEVARQSGALDQQSLIKFVEAHL